MRNKLNFSAHRDLHSPITQTAPSSNYWGVDASFQYGGVNGSASVDILDTNAGIIDSGTALIYLSPGELLWSVSYKICVRSHNTYFRCVPTLRQRYWGDVERNDGTRLRGLALHYPGAIRETATAVLQRR